MKSHKTPIALAVCALSAVAPFAAEAAPTVWFKQPSGGSTITQTIQGSACEVTGTNIKRVAFTLHWATGNTTLVTDTASPWNCTLDVSKFPDGNYTLRATAYDALTGGASASDSRSITIQKSTSSGGSTPNTPPSVSITSPANGATLSGTSTNVSCGASASDTNGVSRVVFSLDGTVIANDTSSPYTCSFNPSTLAPGSHTLKAQATDSLGATSSTQISFNVGATNPPPSVSFKAPANGTTIASSLNNCEVTATDANGIAQIDFFMNGALYHTEKLAPYTCGFGSGKFPAGKYTLKAVATDTLGAKGQAQVSLTIGSGGGDSTAPSVTLTAPAANALLSKSAGFAANATDNVGVAKVDFFLVKGTTKTPIGSDNAAPYQGTFDTTKHANGTYALMAQATDAAGLVATSQRSVTISNTTSNPDPTDPNPGSGTTLPSTNAKGIATFESLGMYWKPGSNPGTGGCSLRYRKFNETAWRQGHPMWYDSRDGECRGSIVHLEPGVDYAVEMGVGTTFKAGVNTRTWSNNFPIGQTIQVQSGSQTLKITQGGTKDAYVLYTGPATLDAGNAQNHNIEISAPYVIVRGLTLKGAKTDAIRLLQGAKDVVIEGNDISGWGSFSSTKTSLTGGALQVGNDRDSAVRAECAGSTPWLERVVVQRNKMHDPRYTSLSWDYEHPHGPQAVTFNQCGGNHVLRYNEVYSTGGNYFNDGFSGGANFSAIGFPNADSDIYGNKITHTRDDAIEAEGGNRNVRIWGNYIDQTALGVATTVVHYGPLYIFRNVYNRSRMKANQSLDSDDRSNFAKSGAQSGFGGGRRYVLHNTLLQATQSGVQYPLGAGGGIIAAGSTSPVTNTVSRNNILHVWKSHWDSIRQGSGGSGNDFDYDLRNGGISAYAGAAPNGIVGTPIYKSGHGWSNWGGGNYQLDQSSPGYDKGARLPNFNDRYTGNGPDVGAHEDGMPAMKFGVSAQ